MSYEELITEVKAEFPDFEIVPKQKSSLMKFFAWGLKVITFGKMTNFMEHYSTTIGYTLYVPANWMDWTDVTRMVTLRHERVHMRQKKKYGFFFFILYTFVFFPTLLAYFRMKFEKEAYEETMRAICELNPMGNVVIMSAAYKARMLSQFTGPAYFWMWPFKKSLDSWYEKTLKSILAAAVFRST